MKIIGTVEEKNLLVSISVKELMNLAGFTYSDDFNKAIGVNGFKYNSSICEESVSKLMNINIDVGAIYKDANETLIAYSELKSKLESVRNQITTLTKKMELAQGED
jgi:hypothetical protein